MKAAVLSMRRLSVDLFDGSQPGRRLTVAWDFHARGRFLLLNWEGETTCRIITQMKLKHSQGLKAQTGIATTAGPTPGAVGSRLTLCTTKEVGFSQKEEEQLVSKQKVEEENTGKGTSHSDRKPILAWYPDNTQRAARADFWESASEGIRIS